MSDMDALMPSVGLLAKIGSILSHVSEGLGEDGHHFDWAATAALLRDGEVQEWMMRMGHLALLPVARKS